MLTHFDQQSTAIETMDTNRRSFSSANQCCQCGRRAILQTRSNCQSFRHSQTELSADSQSGVFLWTTFDQYLKGSSLLLGDGLHELHCERLCPAGKRTFKLPCFRGFGGDYNPGDIDHEPNAAE